MAEDEPASKAAAGHHDGGQNIIARDGATIAGVTQISGDALFQIFVNAPSSLSGYIRIRQFKELIEERTRYFIGRDFLFHAIDEIIARRDFPSGYLLIRGEPGIGKTALICQLVKTRGYLHHFNIAPQNIRSARAFLENVCAQLVTRYQLSEASLPEDAVRDSGYLAHLLAQVAQRQNAVPLVVLVDALDEAEDIGLPPLANRLYLPAVLPIGVFFVLTSREQIDYRLDVDRREDIYLRDNDPQNLEDVCNYVRNFVRDHDEIMSARMHTWNKDEDEFIATITERSEGNFMYVVHVLNDIRDGRISPDTIDDFDKLPKGLRAYYQRHWRSMRDQDRERFERIYEPVLRFLATVREPVSIAMLQEWTQIDPVRVREVIDEWRPFVNAEAVDAGDLRYRIYHASFQDFLANEGVGLKPYHTAIAEIALAKIPGFERPRPQ
jgi:hypothetical protein